MLKIRLATVNDCKKCAELSRIEELRPAGSDFISENYFRILVDGDELFFVAEKNKEVVGYILGEPMKGNMASLGLLAVSEKHRGEGIGKGLVETFRKKCDEKGLKYILLYAPKFNKSTLEFYRKCGFNEGKEHIQFFEKRE